MAGRKITSIRLSEARSLYLADMRSTGKAPNTVGVAQAVLDALENVIGNKVVRNIDKKDINDYYAARMTGSVLVPKLQQSSLNLHTTRLKLFLRWCEEECYIEPSVRPMRGRDLVKVVPKNRLRLPQEDFPRLLDAAPNPRDRMVLALGCYMMLRSSEIRTLRIQDVLMAENGVDVVRWKTRRRDTLPISAELHDEMANYLMWFGEFTGQTLDPAWYLVPGNKRRVARYCHETRRFVPLPTHEMVLTPDRQMFEVGYALIVQKALRKIGYTVEKGEGVHTLRRSGARELFDQLRSQTGFDDALITVMSMLGHAQPSTTLIYLGVEREAARRNAVLKGQVMFPRAAQAAAPVRRLRMVE